MEFNLIYIDENITSLIYNKLDINSKIIFAYINNFTFNNYISINKKLIYKYIYNDYILFKKLLNYFDYTNNELQLIGQSCLKNIPLISEKKTGSFQTNGLTDTLNYYYDLRYFFELIMNNISIKNLFKTTNVDEKIKFMLYKILDHKYLCRHETLWNISSDPALRTLNWNFSPYNKNINWIKVNCGWKGPHR